MTDTRSRKVSLVGQVIEDVTYEGLEARRYAVELVGSNRAPHYKDGGFFAFTGVHPGEYTLRITGERLQPQQYKVTIPFAPLVFEQPGDNELVVLVKTATTNMNGSIPSHRITFDPIFLKRPIRAGAKVLAQGLTTKLAADLEVGRVASAKLESIAGLVEGTSIVRIVRDKSIRMRFDPYLHAPPPELTNVAGKITSNVAPKKPLAQVKVRLVKVNDVNVALTNVAGVKIATVQLGGATIVLGSERDITASTNERGDYNLYFARAEVQAITLRATLVGYQIQPKRIVVVQKTRNRADFQLQPETP
ncbi:MAG TPA: hypothetical protein VF666_18495 [Pyrinomonadaceae bacterium]